MSSTRASDAKRRIGGHFGAAVAASTKRQRTSWRDELDEEAPADAANGNGVTVVNGSGAGAPVGGLTRPGGAGKLGVGLPGDSESEEMVDPGTPLPSDEEGEEAAVPDAAGAPDGAVAPEGESTAPGQLLLEPAPVEQAAGAAAAAASLEAAAAGATIGELSAFHAARSPVEVTFELVVGATACGQLRICFPDGVDEATHRRLAACEPPDGAGVEAAVSSGFCTFGGHGALPSIAQGSSGEIPGVLHSCAGVLSAPRDQPAGLLLTLGPQPQLDATHMVLGKAVQGRSVLRRLQALAPSFRGAELELKPRIDPLLLRRVLPVADKSVEDPQDAAEPAPEFTKAEAEDPKTPATSEATASAVRDSGVLNGCGGATSSSPALNPSLLFSQDQELDALAMATETLEVSELEINGREAEVMELKQMAFSRERVQGVAAVEEELGRLETALTAMESLDEALTHQRSWLQERIRHLLRLLKKLR